MTGDMPPLFYVIGPSGAGKDTLMAGARARLRDSRILFAHRYITRAAEAGGENHVALGPEEFEQRAKAGLFALDWDSHGNRYGIGIEINAWLAAGFAVAVNGSRGYLDVATRRYANLVPILVTAPANLIAARLAARGRETIDAIGTRVARNFEIGAVAHPNLKTIENMGGIEDGVAAMIAALTTFSSADAP